MSIPRTSVDPNGIYTVVLYMPNGGHISYKPASYAFDGQVIELKLETGEVITSSLPFRIEYEPEQ